MPKYLDLDGLSYLWGKITSKFVAKETGKGLSTNDFTTAEKTKLAGIEAGAEANDIEVISVNGVAQTILQGKRVNITVPTSTSDLTNDQIYELGTITTQNGIFVPTSQQVTDIIAMWNRGFCGVHFVESSKDYYVFKQRVINFNGIDFYAFTNSYAESVANIPRDGTTTLGISQSGYGMFGNIMGMTDDGVQAIISTHMPSSSDIPLMDGTATQGSGGYGVTFAFSDHVHPTDTSRQATLVSGTNIKTINGTSILGSGDLTINASAIAYDDSQTQLGNDVQSALETLDEYNSSISQAVTNIRQLPAVTTADNGKVLRVVNGAWAVVSLPSASGVRF